LWAGQVPFVKDAPLDHNGRILFFVQTIARKYRELPWEECEKILDAFKGVAGDVYEEWFD
jgi:hypothetical protein